jgi:hypothetical protein
MKCPLCSVEAAQGATQCPSCGALFDKLRKRAEREKKEAAAALALAEKPASGPRFSIWQLRAAAVGVLVTWIIGFGLYVRNSMKTELRRKAPRVYTDESIVRMRDPVTGKIKEVKVYVAPRAVRPDVSPPTEENWGPPQGGPPHNPAFDD